MLTRLGLAARRWTEPAPWTNVYGLARTLLALGTLGTLVFTPPKALFAPVSGLPQAPYCDGTRALSLFCVVPAGHLDLCRWLAVAALLAVGSGWRPRLTALPHWWVAFSVPASASLPDGGDQVTAVLTLLLLPAGLTDRRRWHWAAPTPRDSAGRERAALVAVVGLFLIRLQVAGIYLDASIAKLGVAQWRDGTALYYWLNDPMFGAPYWLRGLLTPVLRSGIAVATLTWGTLVTEFALALGILLPKRRWPVLLLAGLALHTGIAVLMGLASFTLAMCAALVLYLRPWAQSFAVPAVPAVPAALRRWTGRAVPPRLVARLRRPPAALPPVPAVDGSDRLAADGRTGQPTTGRSLTPSS